MSHKVLGLGGGRGDVSEGLYQQCCWSQMRAKLVGAADRLDWYSFTWKRE